MEPSGLVVALDRVVENCCHGGMDRWVEKLKLRFGLVEMDNCTETLSMKSSRPLTLFWGTQFALANSLTPPETLKFYIARNRNLRVWPADRDSRPLSVDPPRPDRPVLYDRNLSQEGDHHTVCFIVYTNLRQAGRSLKLIPLRDDLRPPRFRF
ncbi:hypothetical protein RRG08_039616 [Elysia crispata]|uniref:Uncharacterized protein n=1 Tax=Elysia crispata TaxID=231223 RepID=A0AAE1CV42_9GAST|nr:hypothetical protein RRG08_039616 [Elysia crispata]